MGLWKRRKLLENMLFKKKMCCRAVWIWLNVVVDFRPFLNVD